MEDDRLLVVVEDDEAFAKTLKRSFERRGYQVLTADNHATLLALLEKHRPRYAVVDLKLASESGLVCVQTLHAHDPDMLIVVLTGFASIATAVEKVCDGLADDGIGDDAGIIVGAEIAAEGDGGICGAPALGDFKNEIENWRDFWSFASGFS